MRKLLNDAIQLLDLSPLLFFCQLFDLQGPVSLTQQFSGFEIISLQLHKLVLLSLIGCSNSLKTLLKALNLFLQVLVLALKIPNLNLFIAEHFLASTQFTSDLFFVVLQKLDLFLVLSCLSFFVADDFIVRLRGVLEFIKFSLSVAQSRF